MLIIGLIISVPSIEFIFKKNKNKKIRSIIEVTELLPYLFLSISELTNSTYNPFIYFGF